MNWISESSLRNVLEGIGRTSIFRKSIFRLTTTQCLDFGDPHHFFVALFLSSSGSSEHVRSRG